MKTFRWLGLVCLSACGFDAASIVDAEVQDTSLIRGRLAQQFGTCVPNPYHQITGSVDLVAEARFGWVRLSAFWDQIEATEGDFDFSILDIQVAEADAARVKILLQVHPFFPAWVTGQQEPRACWERECSALPDDRVAFRAALRSFVEVLVERYRDSVDHWEVWSEPDGPWFFQGTAREFVDNILVPVAGVVRDEDPDALVVGPGLYNSRPFLRQVLDYACDELDVISVHTYIGDTAAERLQRLLSFKSVIDVRCPGRDIWVSEFGFDSLLVGEQQQGALIVDVFRGALEIEGITRVFQYRIRETGTAGHKHGLVVQDHRTSEVLRYKPAFFEVKAFLESVLPRAPRRSSGRVSPD